MASVSPDYPVLARPRLLFHVSKPDEVSVSQKGRWEPAGVCVKHALELNPSGEHQRPSPGARPRWQHRAGIEDSQEPQGHLVHLRAGAGEKQRQGTWFPRLYSNSGDSRQAVLGSLFVIPPPVTFSEIFLVCPAQKWIQQREPCG